MFETGLRVGELVALRPDCIMREGILIDSTEIYYRDKETQKIVWEIKETPKLGADDRVVIIPDSVRITLKKIRSLNPFGEFLFMQNGERIKSIRFNYHLKKSCREVGIPERSTHKIRKTYVSKLLDGNVDESLVQLQMGHRYQDYKGLLLFQYPQPKRKRRPDKTSYRSVMCLKINTVKIAVQFLNQAFVSKIKNAHKHCIYAVCKHSLF